MTKIGITWQMAYLIIKIVHNSKHGTMYFYSKMKILNMAKIVSIYVYSCIVCKPKFFPNVLPKINFKIFVFMRFQIFLRGSYWDWEVHFCNVHILLNILLPILFWKRVWFGFYILESYFCKLSDILKWFWKLQKVKILNEDFQFMYIFWQIDA